MHYYLEFEKPIAELEGKLRELRDLANSGEAVDMDDAIKRLERKTSQTLDELYVKLTPWQKTMVARHPDRPHCIDYINGLVKDFLPFAGDRTYADDPAMLAGFGRFGNRAVAIIGQEKGYDTSSRLTHNFGMARPEGYRKAVRVMKLADRFGLPVVSFVDTAGAYPGIGAEERGQAEAIARATETCLSLSVPNIAIIIGEGGSGGAVAIATANHVVMLEHAIYSVISPEAGASILWRDSARAQDAATGMKITAQDLVELNIIDEIIPEPLGGAHRHKAEIIKSVGASLSENLARLMEMPAERIRELRDDKFAKFGQQ